MSTPSFEIWYLLHFKLEKKSFNSNEDLMYKLISSINVYKKNMNIYRYISDKTLNAISNAKKLEEYHLKLGNELGLISINPYTAVYKPVEYMINEIKKNKKDN